MQICWAAHGRPNHFYSHLLSVKITDAGPIEANGAPGVSGYDQSCSLQPILYALD